MNPQRTRIAVLCLALAGLCGVVPAVKAQNVGSYGMGTKKPPPSPETLSDITITETMQKAVVGKPLPLDGAFYDHSGTEVTIRELIGNKPTILVPVYFACPKLCGLMAQNMIETLRALRKLDGKLVAGDAFNLVMFSINKNENLYQAGPKRTEFHQGYDGRADNVSGVYYLSANGGQGKHTKDQAAETIRELTDAMQFRFVVPKEDKKEREIQHPTAILVLSPAGMVSSYNTELSLDPLDLQQQLKIAALEGTGTTSSRSSLGCFFGDDNPNSWYSFVMRVMAIVALPCLAVAILVVYNARRRARSEREQIDPSKTLEGH